MEASGYDEGEHGLDQDHEFKEAMPAAEESHTEDPNEEDSGEDIGKVAEVLTVTAVATRPSRSARRHPRAVLVVTLVIGPEMHSARSLPRSLASQPRGKARKATDRRLRKRCTLSPSLTALPARTPSPRPHLRLVHSSPI